MKVFSYLTFSGNCREAMTYYQKCFGGELVFQTIGETPMARKMSTDMKECILHSTLSTGGFVIMGSDMVPDTGLVKGNALSLFLHCASEADMRRYFDILSKDGQVKHALELTFWGTLFGSLQDQFGTNWILNFDKKNESDKN